QTCSGLGQKLELNPTKLFDWDKTLNQGAIRQSEYRVGGRRWSIIRASRLFDMNKKIIDFEKATLDKLLYSTRLDLKEDQGGFVQSFSFEGIVTGIIRRRRDKRGLSEKTLGSDSQFFDMLPCDTCAGQRLNEKALSVKILDKNISQVTQMELTEVFKFIQQIDTPLSSSIKAKILLVLEQLIGVGVGYLCLDQP
ncbi:daunorubicin resistance protein DrrC, partial [Candidatus Shapirobacteria bacterium CG10_big_fil_rev_8_21_14_0_10_36_6]